MEEKSYATDDTLQPELLERASSLIDVATFNRIRGIGYNNLTPFQQEMVQKATLAQARHWEEYGETSDLGSISVGGNFSMSFNSGSTHLSGLCEESYGYLKQTGLMRRVI